MNFHPRQRMIYDITEVYGLNSPRVLFAMRQVPREEFVLADYKDQAYDDMALPIGFEQTISQPYTVAFMTHLLDLAGNEKVLEIGTGSGYQAAILSILAKEVYTVEIIPELASQARKRLKRLGFKNVEVRIADGGVGWRQKSPFDAIIVTAGMEEVPEVLFDQLKIGGVLVVPIGYGPDKVMTKYTKLKKRGKEELKKEEYGIFHFVPFIED